MRRWPYPVRMFLALLVAMPVMLLINWIIRGSWQDALISTLLLTGVYAVVLAIGLRTGYFRERQK
ncbi:hypothetical protein ACIBO1_30345 [Micromonospora sp. NPDC049903]|uniref:hypothetical protein n=1 Tax=Micromonospora sp. NPDC049903 TaxID=3364276 RepID=UPI0037AAD5A9